MTKGGNGFCLLSAAGCASVSFYTGIGAGCGGGDSACVPSVITQRCINIAIYSAGFNLTGVGGCNHFVAPCRPIGPLFIGELILVGGVILLVDSYRPIPLTSAALGTG